MEDDIEISVIIVNYNQFELLRNCLASLIEFTVDVSFEVIVIDNNSIDGNVEEITSNFPLVSLIKNKKNLGFGAANNQGLAFAKGKYILFLNNDTVFFENTLKEVFDFAESTEGQVIIGCKLLNQDKTLQHSVYDFPSLLNIFTSNFFLYLLFPKFRYFNKYHLMNRKINEIVEVDVVTGAFLFGSKKHIGEIGGFDERFFFYYEETDLCYRFKKNGGRIYYFPHTSIVHIKGASTKRNLWFKYRNESIATIQFYQKHFKGVKFLLITLIHYIGIILRIPTLFFIGIITLNRNLLIRAYNYIKLMFIYPRNQVKITN